MAHVGSGTNTIEWAANVLESIKNRGVDLSTSGLNDLTTLTTSYQSGKVGALLCFCEESKTEAENNAEELKKVAKHLGKVEDCFARPESISMLRRHKARERCVGCVGAERSKRFFQARAIGSAESGGWARGVFVFQHPIASAGSGDF